MRNTGWYIPFWRRPKKKGKAEKPSTEQVIRTDEQLEAVRLRWVDRYRRMVRSLRLMGLSVGSNRSEVQARYEELRAAGTIPPRELEDAYRFLVRILPPQERRKRRPQRGAAGAYSGSGPGPGGDADAVVAVAGGEVADAGDVTDADDAIGDGDDEADALGDDEADANGIGDGDDEDEAHEEDVPFDAEGESATYDAGAVGESTTYDALDARVEVVEETYSATLSIEPEAQAEPDQGGVRGPGRREEAGPSERNDDAWER